MDQYKLIVYKSKSGTNSSKQSSLIWIELLDMVKETSHIFCHIPNGYKGVNGCGILRNFESIPDEAYMTADISLTKTAYHEMVKEGYSLHGQFLVYDDCVEQPSIHIN